MTQSFAGEHTYSKTYTYKLMTQSFAGEHTYSKTYTYRQTDTDRQTQPTYNSSVWGSLTLAPTIEQK